MPTPPAISPPPAPPTSRRSFIGEYLRSPGQIGAVAPSSSALARRMLQDVDIAGAGLVLEYGPGTGAFTSELLSRVSPQTTVIAIELSPRFADVLRAKHPTLPVRQRSVADVESVLREEGLPDRESVDVIVSGLPWASFPEQLQVQCLSAALRVLRPGGVFVTFGYQLSSVLPAAKRFARSLPSYFADVSRSEIVWRNFPPAFVLRCQKAKQPG